jgi:hypothetical protein
MHANQSEQTFYLCSNLAILAKTGTGAQAPPASSGRASPTRDEDDGEQGERDHHQQQEQDEGEQSAEDQQQDGGQRRRLLVFFDFGRIFAAAAQFCGILLLVLVNRQFPHISPVTGRAEELCHLLYVV